MKQVPQAFEKPIAIIKNTSKLERLAAIIELPGQTHKILAAIEDDATVRLHGNHIDSNAITTIHSRKNAISILLVDAINSE